MAQVESIIVTLVSVSIPVKSLYQFYNYQVIFTLFEPYFPYVRIILYGNVMSKEVRNQ